MQITFTDSLARPRGLAFDSSGNLFAAVNYFAPPNQRHGRILKFPPHGRHSVLGNVALSIIEGLVTDSGGNTFALAQSAYELPLVMLATSTNLRLTERACCSAPFLMRALWPGFG